MSYSVFVTYRYLLVYGHYFHSPCIIWPPPPEYIISMVEKFESLPLYKYVQTNRFKNTGRVFCPKNFEDIEKLDESESVVCIEKFDGSGKIECENDRFFSDTSMSRIIIFGFKLLIHLLIIAGVDFFRRYFVD